MRSIDKKLVSIFYFQIFSVPEKEKKTIVTKNTLAPESY